MVAGVNRPGVRDKGLIECPSGFGISLYGRVLAQAPAQSPYHQSFALLDRSPSDHIDLSDASPPGDH